MNARSPRSSPALRTLAALFAAVAAACGGGSSATTTTIPPVIPPVTTPTDPADAGTPPTDPGDAGTPVTPQSPAMTGVSTGAVVAGHVSLGASTALGTARVEYQLDGAVLASASAAPFAATWDTFAAANGAHTLLVRAIDVAGVSAWSAPVQVTVSNHINHVFVILMENHDWSEIKGSSSAPYINGTLLKQGAHAEKYMNVPGLHPSEPNYIWLEAGNNLGIWDDAEPSSHSLATSNHLVSLLQKAGVSWKPMLRWKILPYSSSPCR